MNLSSHSYLNVLIVEEFEGTNGKARSWTKVGVAFPHADGIGFNLELKAFPRDGKLVVLPPITEERTEAGKNAAVDVTYFLSGPFGAPLFV